MKTYIFFTAETFKVVQFQTDEEAVAAAKADETVIKALGTDGSVAIYNNQP